MRTDLPSPMQDCCKTTLPTCFHNAVCHYFWPIMGCAVIDGCFVVKLMLSTVYDNILHLE